MSDKDRYTTISVHKGLRDDIRRMKQGTESYSEVLYRVLSDQPKQARELSDQIADLAEVQVKQSALLGKVAREVGIDDEEIPDNIAKRADMDDPTDFLDEELRYMFEDPDEDEEDEEDEPPTPAAEDEDEQADVWGSDSPFAPDEEAFEEATADGETEAEIEGEEGPLMPVFDSEEAGAKSDANRYMIDPDADADNGDDH